MKVKRILAGVLSAAMVLAALPMAGLSASAAETAEADSATATIGGKKYLVRELTYDSGSGDIAGAYAESYAAGQLPTNALSGDTNLWHSYYSDSSTESSRNKTIMKGLKLVGNNKIYLTLNEATAISKLTYTGRNNNGDIISANIYAITDETAAASTPIDMTNAVKIGEWNDLGKGETATVSFTDVTAKVIVIEARTTHASNGDTQIAANQIVLYTTDSEGNETAVSTDNITPTADFSAHDTISLDYLLDAEHSFESIWSGNGSYVQKEENTIDNTYPYLVENNNFYIELNNKTALGQISYFARTSGGNNGTIKGANVYVAEKAETTQEASGTEKTEDQILEELEGLSWTKVGTFTTNGASGATADCVFTEIATADYVRIEGIVAVTDQAVNFLSAKQFKLYEVGNEVVDSVSLTMDKPYVGDAIANYEQPVVGSDSYSATISFTKQEGSSETEATTFEAGTYTANVTVTPAANCGFTADAVYMMNGETQAATLADDGTASFTYEFTVTEEQTELYYESITLDGTAGKDITFDAKKFFTTGATAGTSLVFTAVVKFDKEHATEKQTLFTLSDENRYMSVVVQPYSTTHAASGKYSYLGIETSSGNSTSNSAAWYNAVPMNDGNWHKIVVMVAGPYNSMGREVFLIDSTSTGGWGGEACVLGTPFLNANSVPSKVSLGGSLQSLGVVESGNTTNAASNFSGTIGYIKVVKNTYTSNFASLNGSSLNSNMNEKTDATANAKTAALNAVPADMSGYTRASVSAVDTAKTALEGLDTASSTTTDVQVWNAIDALETAVAGLVPITVLDSASVTVAEPVAGEAMSTNVIVAQEDNGKYTAAVTWNKQGGSSIGEENEHVADGDTWTATVTLTPMVDYAFADSVSVNVNGETITGTMSDGSVTVTKTFTVDDKTLAPTPVISLTAPVIEAVPTDAVVTNANDDAGNAQYGTVTTVWSITGGAALAAGEAFTSCTPYTATVTIAPKEGTKFTAAGVPTTVTVGTEEKTATAAINENGNLVVTVDFEADTADGIVINNPTAGEISLTDGQQEYLNDAENYMVSVLFKYNTKTAGTYYPLLTMEGTNNGSAEFITLWNAPQKGSGNTDGAMGYDTSGTISVTNPAGWFFSTTGSNQMADGWYKATYYITANVFSCILNGTGSASFNRNDAWASAYDPLFSTVWSSLSVGTGADVTHPAKNNDTNPADPFEFDGAIRRVQIMTVPANSTAASVNTSVAADIKKELGELLEKANALVESNYTTESWNTFSAALTNANELANVEDGTATSTNNIRKYDWTICNAIDALETAMAGLKGHFTGTTVTLDGNIGLNFYTDQTDTNAVTVKFTKGEGEAATEVPGTAKEYTMEDGTTGLYYTFELPAKEMADTVTATMYDSEENKLSEVEWSVKDYAEKLLGLGEYSADGALTQSETEKTLVKAMLNYGAAAQTKFNHNAGNLANCNLEDADKNVEAIGNELDDMCSSQGLADDSYTGFSLILKSETTLKLYFKTGTAVTVRDADGNEVVTETGTSGDEVYYKIKNIKANDLGNAYTVSVGAGDTVKEIGTVSALTYCYKAKSSTDVALVNTVDALYRYYKAAIAYKESLPTSPEQATE